MHFSIPSPGQNVWYLGPIPIRAYALMILLGIVTACWLTDRRYRAKGGPRDVTFDVAVYAVVAGILGARLYHIVTTPGPYFGKNGDVTKIFRIWEGGLGIWGGVVFGAAAVFVALHRKNLRFAPFADAIVPGLILAQAIGRFGNYFNQELYGKPTDLPWGLEIDAGHLMPGYPPGTLFHPTFLYESLWCIAGAAVLLWAEKKFRLNGGRLALLYAAIYTLGRTWIENLRIDEAQIIAGARLNVWVSLMIFLFSVVLSAVYARYLRSRPELCEIYLHAPEKDKNPSSSSVDFAEEVPYAPDSAGAKNKTGKIGKTQVE